MPELRERLSGAVWGLLVGDAAGVPYEGHPPGPYRPFDLARPSFRQPGTWSDDGSMMLALLDSLLSVGFDPEDQGRRIVAWFRDGRYTQAGAAFGIGGTVRRAIGRLEQGIPALDAGPSDWYDNGNGSLMRILPVGLADRTLPTEELIRHARLASRVTHGHPASQLTCALYILNVRAVLAGEDPRLAQEHSIETLLASVKDDDAERQALEYVLTWPRRDGGGVVWDAYHSAMKCVLESTSYSETIERAIRMGNDADTTAAIAGGLAGAWYGIDGIPEHWMGLMYGRFEVERLTAELVRRSAGD